MKLLLLLPAALLLPLSLANPSPKRNYKVPLEIYIMSKCPDATYCVANLIVPTLERIAPITDFTLSFIGSSTADGVSCKHGPEECLGNIIHLCGAHLSSPPFPPPTDRYIGFSNCLLGNYTRIGQEDYVRDCAKKGLRGARFEQVNKCASDLGENGGFNLLVKSVERTEAAGVKTSCTVRVEGKTVCVRDGGVWKDCPDGSEVDDLVRLVREAYKKGQHGHGSLTATDLMLGL